VQNDRDDDQTAEGRLTHRRRYAIGETSPVVMAELGHTDPGLALKIYAHAMRRDDGENDRLRALVEGAPLAVMAGFRHHQRG
jgi:hypothetical protein